MTSRTTPAATIRTGSGIRLALDERRQRAEREERGRHVDDRAPAEDDGGARDGARRGGRDALDERLHRPFSAKRRKYGAGTITKRQQGKNTPNAARVAPSGPATRYPR